MEKRDVAIILSSYNGEKYIEEQIESILNQTYKKFDLYIHDDGSRDSTSRLIEEYSSRDDRIHICGGEKKQGYPKCFIKLLG